MPTHEFKNCQRCGREYECKINKVTQCKCYEIELSPIDRAMIDLYYQDCLCPACLKNISEDQPTITFFGSDKKMKE